MSPLLRQKIGRAALNAAGIAVFLFAVFPVYWMVATAFKPNDQIFTTEFIPFPDPPSLDHVSRVFVKGVAGHSVWRYLLNSAIVALATVVVGAVFALLAATAVARFRFRFRTTFLILLLIVQMVPAEALLIPLFTTINRLGLYDRLLGLVVVNVGLTLPFSIWMLRTFVAAVPKELEEAAWIDGAGRATAFWRVLFPLVAPGLVATSIFSFITTWNEFVYALTLINDQGKYTMPVALGFFVGQRSTDWGGIMAASTLMTIPVLVFFLLIQRRMVSGLVAGAVKG
ncbi:sugar ABC transporter permease [Thermobispora bispora]|jgi:N,N'-diacetylchitobiose transport system permease protein|uniref:Binding-protein-dependent transport systems inner membrane component n=1 Tax=Thermobispora bispora (strain ATCC 19993 / DSM 43833 / CBS 139.67 / JCM 10125 / KCTC 9307 / NBRC 14880 / R51) TaxID=469371 RepID=D6Y806_THEBD|nr:carbohydrate ABC transporter permease [Thermobispora bispora]ADG87825.1 binding-protein-dependent transport systems inner membrane component [Thermobispora bispora DSM 43833]MBO2473710.1 carbohydrate ABC transporter permease [Actinomycetales bacterium]MBX6168018.1 carbohydrate ABC transporter permease [Thermobispora bispora]QSI47722.1 carbohydrate ABC transporter permease [Thermobispora bispora]